MGRLIKYTPVIMALLFAVSVSQVKADGENVNDICDNDCDWSYNSDSCGDDCNWNYDEDCDDCDGNTNYSDNRVSYDDNAKSSSDHATDSSSHVYVAKYTKVTESLFVYDSSKSSKEHDAVKVAHNDSMNRLDKSYDNDCDWDCGSSSDSHDLSYNNRDRSSNDHSKDTSSSVYVKKLFREKVDASVYKYDKDFSSRDSEKHARNNSFDRLSKHYDEDCDCYSYDDCDWYNCDDDCWDDCGSSSYDYNRLNRNNDTYDSKDHFKDSNENKFVKKYSKETISNFEYRNKQDFHDRDSNRRAHDKSLDRSSRNYNDNCGDCDDHDYDYDYDASDWNDDFDWNTDSSWDSDDAPFVYDGGSFGGFGDFTAKLTGDEETPKVKTLTTGTFEMGNDPFEGGVTATLNVKDGAGITGAHLHCGEVGKNGPSLVTLFTRGGAGSEVDGMLVRTSIDDNDIVAGSKCGGKDIKTVDDLLNAIDDGMIYVNVHSTRNPNGAIRGQVKGNDFGFGYDDDFGSDDFMSDEFDFDDFMSKIDPSFADDGSSSYVYESNS
jgi:hypothetical protein